MGRNLTRSPFYSSNGTWVACVVAIVCFVVGMAVTLHVGQLVRRELVSQQKRSATAGLSEVRARLEGEFSRTVAHGLGIRAYVAQFHDRPFEAADYLEIASELIEENSAIRSIGLAPGNILQAVYPLKPNQAAIGLDYSQNKAQWPAIKKAMDSREVVIVGPLELVQGGSALLIRIPVFPATVPGEPMETRSYWGVATLVLDEAGTMAAAGVKEVVDGIRVAIVDKNLTSPVEGPLFGSAAFQDKDFISLPLHLPGGLQWELLGYPDGGWSSAAKEVWSANVVGGAISLIFAAMAFLLVSEVYKVRAMALHDPLTGLANRRLLEDRMRQLVAMAERSRAGFEIFYVDLDAFKPINDDYGHSVGDQLLIEIGDRLQTQVRQMDTVARVGGDEFIVLTPGNMRREQKDSFLARIHQSVTQVFEYAGAHIDVKASVGSASFPGDAVTIDDLLRVADGRMYADKARSKQKSRKFQGAEASPAG
ncbi:MAG: sensor domain-containing diguanylate cyclase [Roseibium sp.]|nr:sensor domain-containing diguanylate cyclase [Roseibium sp.]